MSWFRRMFDARHRRARAAEGAGRFRRAAELWAAAGEDARAADALLHLAERGGELEDRLEAWHDALRFIPEDDDERRAEVERKMAFAVLSDAEHRGVASAEEKRRLLDAADRLERFDRPSRAADAYRLLGRPDDQARCLEAAGEVDRLESLLDSTHARESKRDALQRLLSDYEASLQFGARREARDALQKATRVAPDDRTAAELLRRLEGRIPAHYRVSLSVAGHRVMFVGRLPATIGRGEVEVPIRGTSVSRRHVSIGRSGGESRLLLLRDLDSRNGTLVAGLPIRGAIELSGETEVGLGDDVALRLTPRGDGIGIEVLSGVDRGVRVAVGEGVLPVEGAAASISFDSGWSVLTPSGRLELEGQPCALPVHLLIGDRLAIDGVPVEVLE